MGTRHRETRRPARGRRAAARASDAAEEAAPAHVEVQEVQQPATIDDASIDETAGVFEPESPPRTEQQTLASLASADARSPLQQLWSRAQSVAAAAVRQLASGEGADATNLEAAPAAQQEGGEVSSVDAPVAAKRASSSESQPSKKRGRLLDQQATSRSKKKARELVRDAISHACPHALLHTTCVVHDFTLTDFVSLFRRKNGQERLQRRPSLTCFHGRRPPWRLSQRRRRWTTNCRRSTIRWRWSSSRAWHVVRVHYYRLHAL